MTNAQVFNAFINGATSGQNAKRSLFIEGDTLYSYGYHHVIAKRHKGQMNVNRTRASVTTSKQTSQFIGRLIANKFGFISYEA